MRGRLRGIVLWQIFSTIRQRAQPDTRVDAVVEFRITGRRDGGIDRYQLALIDGAKRQAANAGIAFEAYLTGHSPDACSSKTSSVRTWTSAALIRSR